MRIQNTEQHLAELQSIVFAKGVNSQPAEEPKTDRPADRSTRLEFPTELDTDGDGLLSLREWNKGKPGWEWLIPIIDSNKDGQIDTGEYDAFQDYKARNPDWRSKRPPAND